MNELTPHGYFRFGQEFAYLQKCKLGDESAEILECWKSIKDFLNNNNLKVSHRVFGVLFDDFCEGLEKSNSAALTKEQAESISESVEKFFLTVSAEALDRQIYVAKETRYEASKLLKDVDKLFAAGVFEKLPEIAKFDFKEACHCILFERPTAAAFHLMRGTEDLIKCLYRQLGGEPETPGIGTWGDYENALKNQFEARVSAPLLEQMRHLRRSFRNPTQHPEKKYDSDEAQDLLNVCIDIANRIGKVK